MTLTGWQQHLPENSTFVPWGTISTSVARKYNPIQTRQAEKGVALFLSVFLDIQRVRSAERCAYVQYNAYVYLRLCFICFQIE